MPVWTEVLGDGVIGGKEPLRVSGGFETRHPLLPLARGLGGVFGSILHIAVLALFDTGFSAGAEWRYDPPACR